MKYFVEVAGREIPVEIDGDRVTVDGRTYVASFEPLPGTPLRLLVIDERRRLLSAAELGHGRWTLGADGERHAVEVVDERARHIRSLTAASNRAASGGVLRAPMPGLVVRIEVETGQIVVAGSGVLVLEAMKMENELRAAGGGRVKAVLVRAGQAVEKGQALVEFEAGASAG